jgi:hypothetical protein
MTTSTDSWFIQPYYSVTYNDGTLTIRSSSKHKKGNELAQNNNDGYLRCKINNISTKIHQIITNHFLGTRPAGLTVNHKDGNKLNNRIENLEYVSIRENTLHSIRTGLHVCCDPTRMPGYKDGRSRDRVAYRKAYRIANADKISAYMKARYAKNPAKFIAYQKAHALAKKNKTTVTTNE